MLQKVIYSKLLEGQEVFGSFESAHILGIDRTKFRNLMQQGHLPSGIKVQWGETVRTVYSRPNLYWIRLFQLLKAHGLNNKWAYKIADGVHWDEGDDFLIVSKDAEGEFLFTKLHEKNLANLGKLVKLKMAIFLNLKALIREIDQIIDKQKKMTR
jgi:hypothetical protein